MCGCPRLCASVHVVLVNVDVFYIVVDCFSACAVNDLLSKVAKCKQFRMQVLQMSISVLVDEVMAVFLERLFIQTSRV